MDEPVKCIRCQTPMESGYMIDVTNGGYLRQTWYRGEPDPSSWVGLKLHKKEHIPVMTLRCPKCGYLESYAPEQKIE